MHSRVAQNTLNFLLSDRTKYSGTDIGALIEILRELQDEIKQDGATSDTVSGSPETEG